MEQPNISPKIENAEVNQESVEKIAKALESFLPNPDIVALEEAVTATPSRLAELYDKSTTRVKAILGAMLFAVTVQAFAGQESQPTEKVEPELSFSQTMEMKEKIKELTGIDIVAEAKKVNREVKLYAPEKKTDRTIINLGQVHKADQITNRLRGSEISQSQQEISKFLIATATPQEKVFVENFYKGYGEEANIGNSALALHAKYVVNFQPAEISPKEDGARKKFYESFEKTLTKITRLNEIITSTINFDFSKEESVLNPDAEYKMNLIKNMDDDGIFADAVLGNSVAVKKLAGESFCKENTECQKIVTEITETDIPNLHKMSIDDREDEAVSLIAEQANSDQKVFPLIYGSSHDFTRAVKKWNDNHPEQQFNLVTVKNQKYF